MSEKKIQVELTEGVARAFVHAGDWRLFKSTGPIADAIRAALPPEYPEGTVAWVTQGGNRYLGFWRNGAWWDGEPGIHRFDEHEEVEPLRVLADDEIAVKRGDVEPWHIRRDVQSGALTSECSLGRWLLAIADALDALDAGARP